MHIMCFVLTTDVANGSIEQCITEGNKSREPDIQQTMNSTASMRQKFTELVNETKYGGTELPEQLSHPGDETDYHTTENSR